MTGRRNLALLGADAMLTAACRATLADLAEVGTLSWNLTPSMVERLDLAIAVLPEAPELAWKRFNRLQNDWPNLKLILISSGLPTNLVVEMLKTGAEDYLELPYDAGILRRKVERAWGGAPGPLPESVLPRTQNRRASFRAEIPEDWVAIAHIEQESGGTVAVDILDMSLPSDTQLGGMSWRISPLAAQDLPLSTWTRGAILQVLLDIPGNRSRIPARAIIVRLMLPPPGPVKQPIDIGVQFTLETPYDERVIERFWAECQRHHKASI